MGHGSVSTVESTGRNFGGYLKPIVPIVTGFAILVGCTAQDQAILDKTSVGNKPSDVHVFTGARQRLITTHQPKLTTRPGIVDPHRIVCAEPSPDVAISVANAFSAGGGLVGQGSIAFTAQSAEGLAQLAERTVSIQLMQMLMYRTCEAYSNGAIPGTVYNSKMDRIFQTMVTLSLAETAGGNFGRSLAGGSSATSGSASASATGLPNMFDGVEDAIGRLAKAEEKVQSTEGALATAKEEQSNLKSDAADEAKTAAEEKVNGAEAARNKAVGERDALRGALRSEVNSAAEAAAAATVVAAGGITAQPNSEIAAVLEKMQDNFLNQRSALTYVDACIVELSLGSIDATDDNIQKEILENLQAVESTRSNLGKGTAAPLSSTDLGATARFMWSGRKSGLFESCRTNLPHMVALDARQRTAIEGYKAETDRLSLVVREKEANAKLASIIDGAIKACKTLGDDAAQKCIANALRLGKTETPSSGQTFSEFLAGIPAGTGEVILPSVPFAEAKASHTELVAERKKLKVAKAPAAHEKFTEAQKKALDAEIKAVYDGSAASETAGTAALSNPEKTRIQNLEKERSQILSQLKQAGDNKPLRKVQEDRLAANQSASRYEHSRLKALRDNVRSQLAKVKSTLKKVEDAKPKA